MERSSGCKLPKSLTKDAFNLYAATLEVVDHFQECAFQMCTSSSSYLHYEIDCINRKRTELRQAEEKAWASNPCLPSHWILSIKQAHSFTEEFITICTNMIAIEDDSTKGTRSEYYNAFSNLLSRVLTFYGKVSDFPTQERINKLLGLETPQDDVSINLIRNQTSQDQITSLATQSEDVLPPQSLKFNHFVEEMCNSSSSIGTELAHIILPSERSNSQIPQDKSQNSTTIIPEFTNFVYQTPEDQPSSLKKAPSCKIGMENFVLRLLSVSLKNIHFNWLVSFYASKIYKTDLFNPPKVLELFVVKDRPHFTMSSFISNGVKGCYELSISNLLENSFFTKCTQFKSNDFNMLSMNRN